VSLIYCGIDEAGYGPLLGPLCVGLSVFRIDAWNEGDAAPDLWALLSRALCREAADKAHRIAINDSKKLKLANSSVRRHPLHHLERGVLAALYAQDAHPFDDALSTDLDFFRAITASSAGECWYLGEPAAFPRGPTQAEVAIAANTLRLALADAGVAVLALRADAVCEGDFNQLVEATGTKAAVTESVIVRYLGDIWDRFGPDAHNGQGGLRVVCDRQGGRTQYAGLLQRALPDARITIVAETPLQSKYELRSHARATEPRAMIVTFKVEAESDHLPVALASMLAKLTRELMMARFNRYWCGRMPDLKPTAGYALDARRWLRDVEGCTTPQERRALIRRA